MRIIAAALLLTTANAFAATTPNMPVCLQEFERWASDLKADVKVSQACAIKLTLDGKYGLIESVDLSRCQPADRAAVGRKIWDAGALPLTQLNGCAETTVKMIIR